MDKMSEQLKGFKMKDDESLKVDLFVESFVELVKCTKIADKLAACGAVGIDNYKKEKINVFIEEIDKKHKDSEDINLFIMLLDRAIEGDLNLKGIVKNICSTKIEIMRNVRKKLVGIVKARCVEKKSDDTHAKDFTGKLNNLVGNILFRPYCFGEGIKDYRINSFMFDIENRQYHPKDLISFIEYIDNLPVKLNIINQSSDIKNLRYEILMQIRKELVSLIKSMGVSDPSSLEEPKEKSPYDEYDESDKRIFGISRESFAEMLSKSIESICFDIPENKLHFSLAASHIKRHVLVVGDSVSKLVEILDDAKFIKSWKIAFEVLQEIMERYKQKKGEITHFNQEMLHKFNGKRIIWKEIGKECISSIIVDSIDKIVDLYEDVDEPEDTEESTLKPKQIEAVAKIKELGDEFHQYLSNVSIDTPDDKKDHFRELKIAQLRIEEAVMWAVKGVTK